MQCKKCSKECMESELIDGYCSDCIKKYGINSNEIHHKENHLAKSIKSSIVIIMVLGCISAFIAVINNWVVGISIFIATLAAAFSFLVIAEIIQLLEDIKNK